MTVTQQPIQQTYSNPNDSVPTTEVFKNLIREKSPSLHEYTLQHSFSTAKYLCGASCGCFRIPCLRDDISHITIFPPPSDFSPNHVCSSSCNTKLGKDRVQRGNSCCDAGCFDCFCRTCFCCLNCWTNAEGCLILCCLLVLVLSIFLGGIYLLTAPVAIFLFVYYEKETTVELDDEKRQVRMTSRGKYIRKETILSSYAISYDQIHDIYAQLVSEGSNGPIDSEYCLVLQTKEGQLVNLSKPLDLKFADINGGVKYLRDFLRMRGVVFVRDSQYGGMATMNNNTMPMNHQMV